jgi:hypothetical protein
MITEEAHGFWEVNGGGGAWLRGLLGFDVVRLFMFPSHALIRVGAVALKSI